MLSAIWLHMQPPRSTKKTRHTVRIAHDMKRRHNVMSAMHKHLASVQTSSARSAQQSIYIFQIQSYQHPTRNFKNATVKYGLIHQVCFVRWPCAMWCPAVWQMCTDILRDDPVRCNVMQYGRWVQMFCEMTLCDLMSCSMADVHRCFVRWPCAMWCHVVWQMCTDVLWDYPVRCDVTVWQMCTDVLWDDPVWFDVLQYGRCAQMFC